MISEKRNIFSFFQMHFVRFRAGFRLIGTEVAAIQQTDRGTFVQCIRHLQLHIPNPSEHHVSYQTVSCCGGVPRYCSFWQFDVNDLWPPTRDFEFVLHRQFQPCVPSRAQTNEDWAVNRIGPSYYYSNSLSSLLRWIIIASHCSVSPGRWHRRK